MTRTVRCEFVEDAVCIQQDGWRWRSGRQVTTVEDMREVAINGVTGKIDFGHTILGPTLWLPPEPIPDWQPPRKPWWRRLFG